MTDKTDDTKSEVTVETRKAEYILRVTQELMKMGFSKEKKVSAHIRANLESENYHSLNMVLNESGFGEGDY
jgi:hypothetical protein